ncbi:hypothetical protein Daudx_0501 [Candidatus Desulforudis audaxviator]|nr:hypothetical protein Daudx_0501 [Candidatus Desulforudis audaxviator]
MLVSGGGDNTHFQPKQAYSPLQNLTLQREHVLKVEDPCGSLFGRQRPEQVGRTPPILVYRKKKTVNANMCTVFVR